MTLGRREILKLAAGGATIASGATALARAQTGSTGADTFAMHPLEAHVRMRGNLRGERTYWYYRGTIFGNRWGDITRPMLRVEGVSFSTIDILPGGRFRYRLKEAGYYADFDSGEVRDRVLNPFTGEYYSPEHYLSSQNLIFSPDLVVRPDLPSLPPGLEYRGVISPLSLFRNTLRSSEDLFVRMAVDSEEEDALDFKVQTSLATLTADVRDLQEENADFVPCELNYQTLATFREWMGMGTTPGMMSWRMAGTKCREEDLPREIRATIAADHPGFFA